jgi:hypothetical protein
VDFYVKTGELKSGWDLGGIWAETENAMKKKIDIVYADEMVIDNEFEQEMRKDLVKIYG